MTIAGVFTWTLEKLALDVVPMECPLIVVLLEPFFFNSVLFESCFINSENIPHNTENTSGYNTLPEPSSHSPGASKTNPVLVASTPPQKPPPSSWNPSPHVNIGKTGCWQTCKSVLQEKSICFWMTHRELQVPDPNPACTKVSLATTSTNSLLQPIKIS